MHYHCDTIEEAVSSLIERGCVLTKESDDDFYNEMWLHPNTKDQGFWTITVVIALNDDYNRYKSFRENFNAKNVVRIKPVIIHPKINFKVEFIEFSKESED